jgi:hypothetical protein
MSRFGRDNPLVGGDLERGVTMAGNKHANAFSLDNEEMASFATRKREPANKLELLKNALDTASTKPDIRPAEQLKGIAAAMAAAPASAPPEPAEDDAVAYRAPPADPQPEQSSPPSPRPPIRQDEISYTVGDEANRGGRPRHGVERKVEKTISMDKSLDKMLTRLGIVESVRLDRKVSAAEVAVHLMLYGLSHMKSNQVLPGEDGKGLILRSDAPTEVALPSLGGDDE